MLTRFYNLQFILIKLIAISSSIKILEKGLLPLERNSIAMQFFLDFENIDKINACKLHARPSKCCLIINKDNTDCDSIKLYGENVDTLKPNDRKTYLYIYPTIAQLNQQGYCDFIVECRCEKSTTKKTQDIKIPFDTRYKNKGKQYLLKNFKGHKIANCKNLDEDPLNDCKPINCDLKYAGAKPFYNKNTSLCEEAAECLSNPKKALPDSVYEPRSNTCKDLDHALSVSDIYLLNSGLGTITSFPCNEEMKVVYKPNCSTISQNVFFLRDMLYGKIGSVKRCYSVDFTESCNNAIKSILSCIIGVSIVLLLFVCCATTAAWLRGHWRTGRLKNKVEDLKSRIQTRNVACELKPSRPNKEVINKLLREVIVSDLPLELRDSVVDVCERTGKEVRWKRRFRMIDVGSQMRMKEVEETDTSTTSDLENSEKERLLN